MLALVLLLLAVPNPDLTPGLARYLNTQQICTIKWGLDKRHVTEAMKRKVLASYGVPWADRSKFEVDHLVPREIGGADDVRNLWPQPLAEAKQKDRAENAAHRAVCAGTLPLADAWTLMRHWGRP